MDSMDKTCAPSAAQYALASTQSLPQLPPGPLSSL